MPTIDARVLALIAESALHHGVDPGAPGERYQVVVHVDRAILADPEQPGQCVLEDGARVSAETSRRLACDASRVVMRHDADGNVVEIGARTRTIPPARRRALVHRDRHCRFPGCAVTVTQGHHLRHWAEGGPTTLSNLALLCRRHHRAVHEEGFRVERRADGELSFSRPNGWPIPEAPPPPALASDPMGELCRRHEALGLHIDPRAAIPEWRGEPLDVGWASACCIPWRSSVSSAHAFPRKRERSQGWTGSDDDVKRRRTSSAARAGKRSWLPAAPRGSVTKCSP
jgi:Domain of unknown function (DUF222)/HNH endonuclease